MASFVKLYELNHLKKTHILLSNYHIFMESNTRNNFSYPASPAAVGIRSAALRSISLSCRTGNRPQSAPACSFLRYGAVYSLLETVSGLTDFYN
jgi:hypothetical protein